MTLKKNSPALLDAAIHALEALRKKIDFSPGFASLGQNVRVMCDDEGSRLVLIQTRSHCENGKYLVGLIESDLEQVEQVVLWFQGEGTLFLIPAMALRQLHADQKREGTASYSHEEGRRQWRVNVKPRLKYLEPQNAISVWLSLTPWSMNVPVTEIEN